jgi:hypothetical protein
MSLLEPPHKRAAFLVLLARASARFDGLCVLGALAGCSVVIEGKGLQDGEPEPPWVAMPGGAQSGAGGAEAGAPGPAGVGGVLGGTGAVGGQVGGGAAVGGDTAGALTGGIAGEPGGAGPVVPIPSDPCGLSGNFALNFGLDVVWEGTVADLTFPVPVIDRGQGMLGFVLLGKFQPTLDGGLQGTVRVCGTTVPDFYSSTLEERYAPRFPEEMWDSISMPSFSFSAAHSCAAPGCPWESQRIHAQLGSQLESPSAAWPVNAAAAFWPDHDGDRQPGITAQMLGPGSPSLAGQAYAYPPVQFFQLLLQPRRVNKLMLGLRMQLLLELTQTECNRLEGMTKEARVDSRAVGCATEGGSPLECSGQELAFLDDNLPTWVVNSNASIILGKRMEADADCADARDAFRDEAVK